MSHDMHRTQTEYIGINLKKKMLFMEKLFFFLVGSVELWSKVKLEK